jgi:hypothetical protein
MHPFPVFFAYSSLAAAEPMHNKSRAIPRIIEANIRFTGIILSIYTKLFRKEKKERKKAIF